MNAMGLMVMMSALGIDFGWEPVAGGGVHYIVQIEPSMLESMKEGTIVDSDLPEVPGGIRRYRIVVGTGPLPHQGEPLPQAPPPTAPSTVATTPAATAAPVTAPTATASPPSDTPMAPMTPVTPPGAPPPVTASPSPATSPTLSAPIATTTGPATTPPSTVHFGPPTATPSTNVPASNSPTISSPFNASSSPARTFLPNDDSGTATTSNATTAQPMTTPKPALDGAEAADPERPWMALTVTLLGLFASLGGNAFLGMVAYSQRMRFDELAERLKAEIE